MTVENWVRRRKATEVAGSLGVGLVALVAGCLILYLLATCPGGVSNEVLAEAFRDRDLAALTRQLRDLEWVVPLEKGVSLTQDLRTELGLLVAAPPPMETGA